jgi:hypothetical protein
VGVGAVGQVLSDVSANAPATLVVRLPDRAHVRVDGHSQSVHGSAPLRLEVAGGEHHVVVTAPGRPRFDQRVRVAPGAAAEVDATQPAKAATATAGASPAAGPAVPLPGGVAPPSGAPAAAPSGEPAAAAKPDEAASAIEAKPAEPPAKKPSGKDSKDTNYTLDPFK